jgi:hypothetical protein
MNSTSQTNGTAAPPQNSLVVKRNVSAFDAIFSKQISQTIAILIEHCKQARERVLSPDAVVTYKSMSATMDMRRGITTTFRRKSWLATRGTYYRALGESARSVVKRISETFRRSVSVSP